ncbi:MAG: DUF4393 domain-containing protein [Planctomycetaceae bacterium]|nr:DUF4393 domain-containing protein [Planctomycetaceae bacterium]
MSKEESGQTNPAGIIRQTIDSATALAKAVPVYDDAIQPFAKEIGKALGTIGKAVNVALAPLSGMVWGYDRIKDFIENRLAEKLANVPTERIETPAPNVAGPAIEALRFCGQDETLREIFANLLATALDKDTAIKAHPSFVEIIKSLSPDEARILKQFIRQDYFPSIDIVVASDESGFIAVERNLTLLAEKSECDHPELSMSYIDNLCRLGLLAISGENRMSDVKAYEEFENLPWVVAIRTHFKDKEVSLDYRAIETTTFGRQFILACVMDKADQTQEDLQP